MPSGKENQLYGKHGQCEPDIVREDSFLMLP